MDEKGFVGHFDSAQCAMFLLLLVDIPPPISIVDTCRNFDLTGFNPGFIIDPKYPSEHTEQQLCH